MDDLQALARENNPTLVQAEAQIRGQLGKALQAGLYPNPILGYTGEQMGLDEEAGEFQGGFVQQEIVTADKLDLSRAKHRVRATVAEYQAVAQAYRVLNDVRLRYYRTLGAEALVAIREELLKNAEDNLLTTKEMLNVGQANRAALHLATAALQQARLELKMARNNLQAEQQMLASIVGAEIDSALSGSLAGETRMIEWEPALQRLLAESPEIAMARTKLQEDRITVRREEVEPIPNIFLQAGTGHNFEAGRTVAEASAFVQLPLFDRNEGTIQQAEADLLRAHAELRRTELTLKRRLAEQYRHYLTALQHVQDYQSIVLPEARQAYELRLKAYRQNRETWPNVLEAERNYFQLRTAYLEHLIAWREAETAIEGLLLVDGLKAPQGPTPPGHLDAVPKPR